MRKVLWVDVETTGVDVKLDDPIQIAMMVEVDGLVVSEGEWKCRPLNVERLSDEVLKFHGMRREDVLMLPDPVGVQKAICNYLELWCNKFDRQDKYVMAGYNVGFDYDILRGWWERCGDKYFGSWFFWPKIDVACDVAKAICGGLRLEKYTLGSCCAEFGVALKAHDALNDVKASRVLAGRLSEFVARTGRQAFEGLGDK